MSQGLPSYTKKKFFDPYDFKSYGTCESCLMDKMTRTSFTEHRDKANNLLGLMHTNVCGPIST